MTESVFEVQAKRYEEAAAELERAAGHLRRSAEQVRNANLDTADKFNFLASAHAHAFATYGHLLNTQAELNEHAVVLASQSGVPSDPDGDPES